MLTTSSLHNLKSYHDGAGHRGSGGATLKRDDLQKTWKALAVLIAASMMFPGVRLPHAMAQAAGSAATSSAQAPLSQDKLDSLLAPIALYPDDLLAQTLMASTYPLDVVAAARFVKENKNLKGDALDKAVAQKNWDPSVQSLTAFPQVLEMMNDKLDWTQELGDAFLADEKRVMQTVQGLRRKADAAGNLKSNEQQKVVKEQQTIIIEPATEVVYVPTYNPTVVYGSWWAPAYPPYYYPPPPYYYPAGGYVAAGLIGFGLGVAIANNHWGWCNTNWNGGNVNVNVNRNNTFINNNAQFKNKVNNGTWNHNPAQRKGVAYGDARTREQYRKSDPGATAARRDARGYDGGGRAGPSAGTRDMQRGGAGPSAGTRDMQRGGGDFGGAGPGAGTRDMQRGGGDFGGGSSSRPSFDAGQSRQQANSYSNRGASSRASMGGSSRSSGGYSGGGYSGGGRSGGGARGGGGGRGGRR